MKEQWKDIKDYEGLYQISNFGNVKSLRFNKERLLKPGKTEWGHRHVVLSRNGNTKTNKVTKLVAMAFLGHEPNGFELVIDHIDNDPTNDHVDNLQLITMRTNSSKDRMRSSSFVGVSRNRLNNKWNARIRIDGTLKHLGTFNTEIEASEAYQNKLKTL